MGRTMIRLATVALLASTCLVASTQAAATQSYLYNTSGSIAGVTGSGYGFPISFTPQTSTAMLTTPGTFNLGTFVTNPLPTGATLNYVNTPFEIDVNVGPVPSNQPSYFAVASGSMPSYGPVSTAYTYKIMGVLNGSLMGDGTSTLFPTIASITGSGLTPPFDASALQVNLPQGIAAPNGFTYGSTTLVAHVDVTGTILPAPAPEPTSVAVFAVALAGLAWNRRRSAGRKVAAKPDPTC